MNASDHKVKSFALGYSVANTVLDTAEAAKLKAADKAIAAKDTAGGFIAGVRYALAERRGEAAQPVVADNDVQAAKLRAAQELYARAHGGTAASGELVVVNHGE